MSCQYYLPFHSLSLLFYMACFNDAILLTLYSNPIETSHSPAWLHYALHNLFISFIVFRLLLTLTADIVPAHFPIFPTSLPA